LRLERRRAALALRRHRLRRDPRAPTAARRAERRRRGGGEPRGRRWPRPPARRRLRDDRDGGRRRRQRPDRLRRDHRPARDPPRRGAELPPAAAAVRARRRRVPRADGRRCADGAVAGGAADRRRHRLLRRAVLRCRAADEPEDARVSRRRLDGGAGEPGTPAPPAPGAATSALAARSVSVSLGGRRAVDSVSLAVERGEWLSLIGPNGAGKTTLLRAIAGLVRYDGEIELGGVAARRLGRREVARRVAVVPQAPLMPAGMGVREYVLLGRTPYVSYTGKEGFGDHAAAERALRRLDLDGLAERQLGSLSGGERQRAVLARALAQEAPLLLLDEPTSALDAGRQQDVL